MAGGTPSQFLDETEPGVQRAATIGLKFVCSASICSVSSGYSNRGGIFSLLFYFIIILNVSSRRNSSQGFLTGQQPEFIF